MKINNIWTVTFSPTENTRKVSAAVAGAAAAELVNTPAGEQDHVSVRERDFTLPEGRQEELAFGEGDLVILGVPTYAGRVPNKIMPFIKEKISGRGAYGVAVVTYGNRSYDDSLMELSLLMKENGFRLLGGGAFVCQHAFAGMLAAGRPDSADLEKAENFGRELMQKIKDGGAAGEVHIPGNNPVGPYYTPKRIDGQPAVFLKAKPETDQSKCVKCGLCAAHCPMGSIDPEQNFQAVGICIKCQSCVQGCPQKAKYFSDEAFLSHKAMLEANYASRRPEPEFYI